MVKAIASDVGPLALDQAEFVQFHNYNFDTIAALGAYTMSFIAKEAGVFYEVTADFIVGIGNEEDASKEVITVAVSSVSELAIDEDGDLYDVNKVNVAGTAISVPMSAIMSVVTVVHDSADIDAKYDELEHLVKGDA